MSNSAPLKSARRRLLDIDLHGFHPDDVDVEDLLKQAWEMSAAEVTLIHGHGHNRGLSVGFVNTNTGYFGLRVRGAIRRNSNLKPWVKITTLDCSHDGSTSVKLRENLNPTRAQIELPEPSILCRRGR